MAKIRMIVIEGEMSVEDVQRLAQGFSAGDAAFSSVTLPSGVTAQAATLARSEEKPRPRPIAVPVAVEDKPVVIPVVEAPVTPTKTGFSNAVLIGDVFEEVPTPERAAAANAILINMTQHLADESLPAEIPPAVAKVFPEAVVETEEQTNAASLIDDLVACKRLSGVIERLQREGHTDTASLIAACKTHRDSVPLLQRLGEGLEDRVTRTLEGMK